MIVYSIYDEHKELGDMDTSRYRQGSGGFGGFYYCRVKEGKDDCILQYSFVNWPKSADSSTELVLTSGAKYGEGIVLMKHLGFFEKRKYKHYFEKYFFRFVELKIQKMNQNR